MKQSYVYMMSNQPNGTLYVGVTSDLIKRAYEHKHGITKGFTSKYKLNQLVYYEISDSIESAIRREKYIKKYPRKWKLNLINQQNPDWSDLYNSLLDYPDKPGNDEEIVA